MSGTRTHFRTCTLCEAMCGVAIDVENGAVKSVRGDVDDPFSRGHICPKAVGLKDVHEDPDRLQRPRRRTRGGAWQDVSWDSAFDEVADRLRDVQRAHGKNAVAVYQGNPSIHNWGTILYGQRFVRALRTKTRFSATSVDQLPHHLAALEMFGHQVLLPVPDLDRTQHLVIIGANPLVSNGSLMTAPDVKKRLEAIVARGGKVVVIDPRRTETAAIASEHHFVRPGTDVLLLAAMVHTICEDNLVALGRLAAFTDGVERAREAVRRFSPEVVADRVGIDATMIRAIAHDLANASSGSIYGRIGVCTQAFGGACIWLVSVLNVLTGNLDREGGAMFTSPAFDIVDFASRIGMRGHFGAWKSRVRGLPEFGGELPVAAMAEEIDVEGAGQLKALVTSCGNPVLSTPNGARLERALPKLDFMASVDVYVNETTRHADVILPPTWALEHDHYDLALHALAIRNTAKYSPAVFERTAEQRHDWEIFEELSARLEGDAPTARLTHFVMSKLGPRAILDLGLRWGPWGHRRRDGREAVTLRALEAAPHGVDLGALTACLPERLGHRDRRIALAPRIFLDDLDRAWASLVAAPHDGLLLIGRRQLRGNNSWMHNSERLVKGRDRCTLLMHPRDASARSITEKSRVRVEGQVGAIEVAVELTDSMMEGVVSLPHGFGHDREGVELRVARAHGGASMNDVVDESMVDALSGNAVLSGVPVRVAVA
ncbi:MAG: molybdopterin-dependent oxidoreductase [Polyangiales bacterium]